MRSNVYISNYWHYFWVMEIYQVNTTRDMWLKPAQWTLAHHLYPHMFKTVVQTANRRESDNRNRSRVERLLNNLRIGELRRTPRSLYQFNLNRGWKVTCIIFGVITTGVPLSLMVSSLYSKRNLRRNYEISTKSNIMRSKTMMDASTNANSSTVQRRSLSTVGTTILTISIIAIACL